MRIYYVGDLPEHTDERLAGVVLSHGQPVDVHNAELVDKLLALPWFSLEVIPAVAMADHASVLFEEMPGEAEEDAPEEDEPVPDEEADDDDEEAL